MPALQHSFKTLRREWRSGELRLIAAALIVAIAAVTAVTLFTIGCARPWCCAPTPCSRPIWLSPAMLDAFSESYITSFYLGREQKPWLFDLMKRFPSVPLLDLLERGVG